MAAVTKTCRACNEEKDINEFYKTGKNMAYRSTKCKPCDNAVRGERAKAKNTGFRRSKLEMNDDIRQQIQDLIDQGVKIAHIPRTVDVSLPSIYTYLRKGIITRLDESEDSQ